MIKLTEKQIEGLRLLINQELKNQMDKFGDQQHDISLWQIILVEEIGEISKAILESDWINLNNEIIQSITVLIQMLNKIGSI